ncbi:hypothetical protein LCGC14_0595100 [marine sediment metagenome]|uniref:Uncharacterized protein n=1 Tax=marine sediment metagenome TaxID=412755 RepID=A0A0F9TYE7_9ZZZZ
MTKMVNLIRPWYWYWLRSDRKNWMLTIELFKMVHVGIWRSHGVFGWKKQFFWRRPF